MPVSYTKRVYFADTVYISSLGTRIDSLGRIVWDTPGLKMVSLIACNQAGCDTSNADTVFVRNPPPGSVSVSLPQRRGALCSPADSLLLIASSLGGNMVQYNWTYARSLSDTSLTDTTLGTGAARTVYKAGIYIVEAGDQCGSARDTVFIPQDTLQLRLPQDTLACQGAQVTLTLPAGFTSPVWNGISTGNTFAATVPSLVSLSATSRLGCPRADTIKLLADPCTGILKNQTASSVKAVPNPATGSFTLQGIEQPAMLRLYDLTGRLAFSKSIGQGETIPVRHLPRGLYRWLVQTEKGGRLQSGSVVLE